MRHKKHLLLSLIATTNLANASESDRTLETKDWIILPYAFSSDVTGPSAGVSFIQQGLFQPQTTLVTTVVAGLAQDVTTNGKEEEANFLGGFISFSDYRLPFSDRFFFSFIGLKSYFPRSIYYLDGSNDSSKEDAFVTSGESNFINTSFRYVLPIGDGLDNPEGIYSLNNGFCVNREGCGGGTPFLTGETSIGLKTFFQTDNTDNTEMWKDSIWWENGTSLPTWNTNGLRFFLTHDNTDFDLNPSRGYHSQLQYSKDFGWGDSLQSWDFLELKYNQYFNLDTFSFTKQNVLALSMWTGYSFSWDNDKEISPGFDAHRPPLWEGARLGGYTRMRGYDQNRFSDKAAFYAVAEYRAIIDYNPLKNSSLIPFNVDWFQLVGFIEAGRVHDQYNFDLVTNMKYDIGIGLRAMIEELPIRLDIAFGDEGANMWLMVQQPFDF